MTLTRRRRRRRRRSKIGLNMPETDSRKFKDPKSVLNANIFGFVRIGEYNLVFNVLHGLLSLRLFSAEKIRHMLSGISKLMTRK